MIHSSRLIGSKNLSAKNEETETETEGRGRGGKIWKVVTSADFLGLG